MGVFYRQVVVCITYDGDSPAKIALNDFVESNKGLFTKSETLINGFVNYVMFWDGSKEGWDESNKGNQLREEFLKLINKLDYAYLYEINDHEEYEPILKASTII